MRYCHGVPASRFVAIAALVVAPIASLAAQIILHSMPAAETALERIRLSPDAWSVAHLLIAIALGGWIMAGVVLLARTALSITAFVVLTVGVIAAAMTNGVDAVLGVLAEIDADTSIHQAIAENLVQPLDLWDSALTLGLVALVVLLHMRGTVPWWGTTTALVALAIPAFSDLRIVAAGAVLLGFVVLAFSHTRPAPVRAHHWGWSAAIALAFVPAAFFSVERAVLLAVVVVLLAVGRLYGRRVPPAT